MARLAPSLGISRVRRIGLLGRFALASAIVITLLGVAISQVMASTARTRAFNDAERVATLVAATFVEPHVSAATIERSLTDAEVVEFDTLLAAGAHHDEIMRIKVWSRRGRVVYSNNHSIIGRTFPISHDLAEALEGEVSSEVSEVESEVEPEVESGEEPQQEGGLFEVYVPLFDVGVTEPIGVFEIYMPYAPVAQRIAQETRALYLTLSIGLAVLYLVLYRIAAGASRRLRQQARDNERLALHDALTGLANRSLFRDRAEQAVRAARRDAGFVAVLLIDLDRFKEVNDTLGHHNGDLLLQEVARRLQATTRETDTVARLGGDEFGVVLSRVGSIDEALTIAANIRYAVNEPMTLSSVLVDVDVSVGVVLYPTNGDDIDVLLQRADIAMYTAKREGSGVESYHVDNDDYSTTRLALVAELRLAIENDELCLEFQPKFDLTTMRIAGVEALVRWEHPDRGLLSPIEFIPTAERTGLIRQVTSHVLVLALDQLQRWHARGIDTSVSVNLSTRDLLDLELPDRLADLLTARGLPADRLCLEITETALLTDPVRTRSVVDRLTTMGVRFSIDDFGTGYSSLAYLEQLPVHEIKIDKTFIQRFGQSDHDAAVVRAIVDLGHNLGLDVVAEGVESPHALQTLRRLGCDLAQGYLLARPLAPDAVALLIQNAPATLLGSVR
jgi:diguanylate cyclase (GGDEF)-like protein